MGNTASVPQDPSRKLEVIDAGFSRTGTLSFAMALEKLLDGPVMHGGTQVFNREDAYCKQISQIYAHRRAGDRARMLKSLQACIAGFVGCADVPMLHFIPELLELYPDVKVVLVTRDPERWWRSYSLFGDNSSDWSLRLTQAILLPLPGARWFPATARGYLEDPIRTHGRPASSKEFIEVHNQWVRDLVPKDRLLEMDLADGWEPLCQFLGKPIPDEPFPRANDKDARDRFMRRVLIQAGMAWVGIFSAAAVAGFGAWGFWKGP
ncbi:Uu.00g096440.m01.CDS01 [Anthostomella pinea]|uniref:Uu.00g096440.m01.CDS01 n=1 Tax=Anthostomella pinea TaxID=933095 RepID=A0AAI8VC71_9PEZI|nr:Uu.00g096440.m01.CDS01 [Anthostomella pinea]